MKSKLKSIFSQGIIFFLIFLSITLFQQRHLLENDSPAPYFNLQQLNQSERISIRALQGKETVVYFFAPWCTICKLSMPNLDKLHQSGTINAVAIAADFSSIEQVQKFTQDLNLSIPVLLADRHTASNYNITAFPTYYVISPDLKITSKSLGYSTELGIRARTTSYFDK